MSVWFLVQLGGTFEGDWDHEQDQESCSLTNVNIKLKYLYFCPLNLKINDSWFRAITDPSPGKALGTTCSEYSIQSSSWPCKMPRHVSAQMPSGNYEIPPILFLLRIIRFPEFILCDRHCAQHFVCARLLPTLSEMEPVAWQDPGPSKISQFWNLQPLCL